MIKNSMKEKVDDVLEALVAATELIKHSKPIIVALMKETCASYSVIRAPFHKINDETHKRQAERLHDLVANVGLDSRDAVRILKMDSVDANAMIAVLREALNASIIRDFVLPLVMGVNVMPHGDGGAPEGFVPLTPDDLPGA